MQGRTDIDLSERGRAEVAALAAVVAPWRPQTVVCSPLARAITTASLLSEAVPIVDSAWIEHSLGEWEGATAQAIGPAYEQWRAGTLIPPGGEPSEAIRARVLGAVRRAAAYPGPVLVVTHGGTIRAVLERFVGLGAGSIHPVAAPSLTVLDVEGESTRLRQFNVGAGLSAAETRAV